ncbi:MAG: hypothetical protein ACLFVB_10420 [Thermoplasmata archaeon]
MKSIAIDTSALVSLGHTELVEDILWIYDVVISKGILCELEEISKIEDDDGEAAKKWLELSSQLDIRDVKIKDPAEDELFDICKDEGIVLFTDDINAVRRLEKEIDCYFSVHMIYLLYKKDIISENRAMVAVETMKTNRDWRQNLIVATAKTLFY